MEHRAQAGPSGSEWIGIDLGGSYSVSRVMPVPHFTSDVTLCFPVDFKLQTSADGVTYSLFSPNVT